MKRSFPPVEPQKCELCSVPYTLTHQAGQLQARPEPHLNQVCIQEYAQESSTKHRSAVLGTQGFIDESGDVEKITKGRRFENH